ncbi:MAG: tetratricopeptide repeat protein [Spirochaetales bacterium]|nr:tetratricopeptide repeat protein [Spirochaetales bacterium]
MKKNILFSILLMFTVNLLFTDQEVTLKNQESFLSLLDLSLGSGIEFPVEPVWDLLDPGIPVAIKAGLPLPSLPWLLFHADFSYTYLPLITETSISFLSLGAGSGINIEINPRWVFLLYGTAGGYYGFFNESAHNAEGGPRQGGSFYFLAGFGLEFYLTPIFSMGLQISSVNYYFGLHETGMDFIHVIRGGIGGTIHIDGFRWKVTIDSVQFSDIFPAHYKYYESNSAGTCVIRNKERFPVSDISVTVFVPQYMDRPTKISVPPFLKAGQDREVTITLLFSDKVRDLTESNKVTAEIEMEYTLNGRKRNYKTFTPVRLLNRNAITWDNAGKAAAFVTAIDSNILQFAKPAAGTAKQMEPILLDENLRIAMAVFNTLSLYGIHYVSDPNKPLYKDASKNADIIDFLQFPVQTLTFKAGDCDDLTILYCTLLESVGIETAFIRVPGHILPAFRTKMDAGEIDAFFYNTHDFIMADNSAWIPVEATLIGDSFREAWETGAGKWQDSYNKGKAEFHPVHNSWKTYEAADFSVIHSSLEFVSDRDVKEKYADELKDFIQDQLSTQIAEIKNRIEKSENKSNTINLLGMLYAKYGFYNEAESIFLQLIEKEESLAALINLGNVYFIKGRYEKALEQYKKAETLHPGNEIITRVLENINDWNNEKQPGDDSVVEYAFKKIKKLEWLYEKE